MESNKVIQPIVGNNENESKVTQFLEHQIKFFFLTSIPKI